jgi:hypothetical protein
MPVKYPMHSGNTKNTEFFHLKYPESPAKRNTKMNRSNTFIPPGFHRVSNVGVGVKKSDKIMW